MVQGPEFQKTAPAPCRKTWIGRIFNVDPPAIRAEFCVVLDTWLYFIRNSGWTGFHTNHLAKDSP